MRRLYKINNTTMRLILQYISLTMFYFSKSLSLINKAHINIGARSFKQRLYLATTITPLRIPAGSQTLDTQFISEHYDIVVSHLKSRKASSQLLTDVSKIPVLRTRRNALIVERDTAKNSKKTLSQQIGGFMKSGNNGEVVRLKAQVEEMDRVSDAAEEQLQLVDAEIDNIVAVIPNLIDDR